MKTLDELVIIGGHPAANFVNTLHNWTETDPEEYLHQFDDFVRWNRMVGLIDNEADVAEEHSKEEEERVMQALRRLRVGMHDVFASIVEKQPLSGQALDHLNEVVHQTARWRRLTPTEDGLQATAVWDLTNAPAEAFLGPVAWACADLLENGPLDRLKICPADDCGWLFLDLSKNRSRHWCSMTTCGNAAKVRRFRQRKAAH